MFASAALIAVFAVLPQPGGGPATMDRTAYIAELERAETLIRAAGSREALAAAAETIPPQWRVTVDGTAVAVDAMWLRRDVAAADAQSWAAVRTRVAGRLSALRAEALEAVPGQSSDPEPVLQNILAAGEFRRAQGATWAERLRKRISEWLIDLFTRLFGRSIGSRTVAVAFAWTASAIALAALSLWLVTTLARRSRATALDLKPAATRAAAREWALKAIAAARAGDLREAVRCGYNAALCRLEEQGAWTIDDARTPREYVRLLERSDPRRSTLGDLTQRFERVWYAGRAATSDDARQIAAHLERLGCLRPGDQTI